MSMPTSKYIIKIDEDIKFVHFNDDKIKLEMLFKKYYKNNEVTFTTLPDDTDVDFMKSLVKANSFFNNTEFDINEFIESIIDYNKSIKYFNTNFTKKESNKYDKPKFTSFDISLEHFRHLKISECEKLESSKYNRNEELKTSLCNYDLVEGYTETNTSEPLNIDDFCDTLLSTHILCNIYYNNQFNNINVIEIAEDSLYNLSKDVNNSSYNQLFPELILLFNRCKLTLSQKEQLIMSKEILVNEDDARTKINKILNDTIIDSKLTINEMKELITKYFTITTNLENRVKFTKIWEIITRKIKINEQYVSYLKRQLPMILEDLNLQKKRYTDGIYWYGLIQRNHTDTLENKLFKELTIKNIDESTYNAFLEERAAEITPIVLSKNPDEFLSKMIKQ